MKVIFFNRQHELDKLIRLVFTEPNMITFIYGPINSGKTALMMELTRRLSDEYVAFYINLRRTPVMSYDDFIDVLFSVEFRSKVKTLKEAVSLILSAGKEVLGFPIPTPILEGIIREKKPKNAFAYIATLIEEVKKAGKKPILILDELQVIGDLKINGPLIYELFNFFVHLTKERHLSHVFVVTSDSLFIDKVYNEAMLQGRAEYFLVDDFDRETAVEFLKNQGFSINEAELVWEYFGGKPVYLVESIKHKDELKEWCESQLRLRVQAVNALIHGRKSLARLLKEFQDKEEIPFNGVISRPLRRLVKANILFVDPLKGVVRPQGKLELLAIRKALKLKPNVET
ncbi:ATP-binding protein [Pyrococcus kukulkanii]|uniref:ATP-binding protein n=1 Tax=Pyrococcus kukulkanii TaxID=1609559 RepID=UPI003564129E